MAANTFNKVQPILMRESDGMNFEPTVQPGMVRCECCLGLCEPSRINEHRCSSDVIFGQNKLLRTTRK